MPIINPGQLATGSYNISGSFSGSFTGNITGAITGTATSASYAETASFAVSASHEIIQEISSSYAQTASIAENLFGNPSITVTNTTASGNISASGDVFGTKLHLPNTLGGIGITINNLTALGNDSSKLTLGSDNGWDAIEYGRGDASQHSFLGYITSHITASGDISASGTIVGSGFIGSGAGLTDIPASSITGLNLSQISSGSVSASIAPDKGFEINTNITASGNISASGDLEVGNIKTNDKIYLDWPTTTGGHYLEFNTTKNAAFFKSALSVISHITASGNISSSGTIVGSNLSGTNTGDQDLAAYALTANVVANSATASFAITASNVIFANITSSGNISSSGNILANNVFLAGAGKISFDDSQDGTDQFISGVDNQIAIDGDNFVKVFSDKFTTFYNSSNEDHFTIQHESGSIVTDYHISASGNISGGGTIDIAGAATFGGIALTDNNYDAAGTAKYRIDGYSVLQNTGTTLKIAGNNYWETITYGNEVTDEHSFTGNITASNHISASGVVQSAGLQTAGTQHTIFTTASMVYSGSSVTQVTQSFGATQQITNIIYSASNFEDGNPISVSVTGSNGLNKLYTFTYSASVITQIIQS